MSSLKLGHAGSIFATLMATEERYSDSLFSVFPSMLPEPSKALCDAGTTEFGLGFTKEQQAAHQVAAMVVTFLVAIVGGLVTGVILNLPIWQRVSDGELFEDYHTWVVEEEKSSVLDSLNNALRADYGSLPQQTEEEGAGL
jgi:ammonium transporter Rh